MQITHLSYDLDDTTEAHWHSCEQCGVVLSGAFRLHIESEKIELSSGETYPVPARAKHVFEVIEPGDVIIVAPPEQTIQ